MGLIDVYNQKQINVLKATLSRDWFITLLHGAKRSGKTKLNNDLFLFELRRVRKIADEEGIKEPMYILAGVSSATIQKNILQELYNTYNIQPKYDKHGNFKLFGVKVVQAYTGNIGGVGSIRGMTAYGAYINEASLARQEVFAEIVSRCSATGARILADTNPDNPEHWLKKEYIENASTSIQSFHFQLDDNTFLSERYRRNIKQSTPSGMFYDRDIKGLWVSGQGTVYSMFDKEKHYVPQKTIKEIPFDRYIAGVDFGFSEGHNGVIVLFGVKGNYYYLIEEHAHTGWYIDKWCDLALELTDSYGDIPFFCDSARPEHVAKMRDKGIQAALANKRVLAGIETVSKLFHQGKLFILENVQVFKKEIYNYVWNEKTGEPVKADDDVLDAIRYALHTDSIVYQSKPTSADEGAELIHKMTIY